MDDTYRPAPAAPRGPLDPRERLVGAEEAEQVRELRRDLSNARRLSARVLDALDCCLLVIDAQDRVRHADGAARALLGYLPDELEGRPARDVFELAAPAYLPLHRSLLEAQGDVYLRDSAGQRLPIALAAAAQHDLSGALESVACVCADLTSLRHAEIELGHSQKLESVGQLAAGIAHEINTPIQFIGDSTRFLRDSFASLKRVLDGHRRLRLAVEEGADPGAVLEEIRSLEEETDLAFLEEEIPLATEQALEGIDRVATIVRAMRSFAHPGRGEKTPQDINEALRTTLTVSRNEYKYLADVQLSLAPLPDVYCNAGEINQVFLNLVVNAAHAIADRVQGTSERGTIGVRTHCIGRWVEVQISDTGCGIPRPIQGRIFDPFFTTKEVGRGTGQGLALARKIIVDRYGGELDFESTPGEGTIFVVRLPIGTLREQAA